ncbi:Aste57867_2670 [Aphanomyces stellatus]|uniref:Aste57867_2670 protein n=1 Tax=Aphanomyces stellatus TaxID=120398 RepID=A0A485KAK8_9STRA|nr:hypothetical protein As57867_002663 [Aphanomyces stellatus]VFT79864.1 Aste57867_2670 [Aphanomyces stellatus]
MKHSRTFANVILMPGVLRLICAHQQGICEDMRPLAILAICPIDVYNRNSVFENMTTMLLPWFGAYNVDRLELLFQCIPNVLAAILMWAVSAARLDILAWMQKRHDLVRCSDMLLVVAVTTNQPLALEYLDNIGYVSQMDVALRGAVQSNCVSSASWLLARIEVSTVGWLDETTVHHVARMGNAAMLECLTPVFVSSSWHIPNAIGVAASHGHLQVARWLYALGLTCHVTFSVRPRDLNMAAKNGHLECFRWLFDIWSPFLDETELAQLIEECLHAACAFRQPEVAQWLAARASPTAIHCVFLRSDSDGTILDTFVDPTFDIDLTDLNRGSLSKLEWMFQHFCCLRPGQSSSLVRNRRDEALAICLRKKTEDGHVSFLEWLLDQMDLATARDVVCKPLNYYRRNALQVFAENQLLQRIGGRTAALDLFEAQNIRMTDAQMYDTMMKVLRDKFELPPWFAGSNVSLSESFEHPVANWMIERLGGRVVVLSQLMLRLTKCNPTPSILNALFKAWISATQVTFSVGVFEVQGAHLTHAQVYDTMFKLLCGEGTTLPEWLFDSDFASNPAKWMVEQFGGRMPYPAHLDSPLHRMVVSHI